MLDEFVPVGKPSRKVKILAAESNVIETLPVIDSKISFLPYINYLKEKRTVAEGIRADIYKYLINRFEAEPALLQPIPNVQLLNEHSDLLELLGTTLFPVVGDHEKNSFALAAPYQFQVFYYSESFKNLFLDKQEENLLLPVGLPLEKLKEIECSIIYEHVLEKFYGVKLNDSPDLIYPVVDPETGFKRYYRIYYDRRFIDVHLKGTLPSIQDCGVCLNTFRILDMEHQLKKMPLDLFRVEGFAVWKADDVTTNESLETIKKILLRQNECDAETIKELKGVVQALVGLNEVEVGLMPLVKINKEYVIDEDCTRHSILGKYWRANDQEDVSMFHTCLDFLGVHPEPTALTNLSEQMLEFAPFMKPVIDQAIKSYIQYPMQNSDGLLGILEVASPLLNQFNHEIISKLEPAVPLLSVAMLKHRDSFNNKIENLIKEKFTALQNSVEWKFAEVAWDHLKKNGNSSDTANVVFENVYPLYGAIDIRNSSQERSHAIQKDMKEHLCLTRDILDQLQSVVQLPLLEGLKFKNQSIQQSIQDSMVAEDEVRIHEFLESEVEPVFSHLQKTNNQAKPLIENYFKLINDCDSQLYRFRREYEQTLATINDTVLSYLEKEEEVLQLSYPHYFEKYRTDGVEYNIYIGQSIAPGHPFDLLYLKNLRLWQLKSMAQVARITNKLLPTLNVPLQTTQLILIHSQCISINFRRDERRFDVEGSYNIRYEMIKKRLDKVRIHNTHERLTQPGKIGMVYSNQKEIQEYQQYIEFLQNKNILKSGIEFLELEELQGVKGLRAMRVDINMDEE